MAADEVTFDQISLELDGQQILKDIHLSLAGQSTTALLGRSGSGKTTLLRTINALVTPTAGKVCVHGRNVTDYDRNELRRGIGYVIQESGLFPHMTIGRNVAISYEEDRRSRAAADERGSGDDRTSSAGVLKPLSAPALRRAKAAGWSGPRADE